VFPPHWYYTAVPADLLYTGSFLRARGAPVRCLDLSAGALAALLGDLPGWLAFRNRNTYADPDAYHAANRQLWRACGRTTDTSPRPACGTRYIGASSSSTRCSRAICPVSSWVLNESPCRSHSDRRLSKPSVNRGIRTV
jgi:hypothetical protein